MQGNREQLVGLAEDAAEIFEDGSPGDPVWPGMPLRDFVRIARHLRHLGNELGLRDWTIVLMFEPTDDEEDGASCGIIYGRRLAEIRLGKDFASITPDKQQHFLVHELLHIHLDPLTSLIEATMPDLIGKAGWTILDEAQRERTEHAVDALAAAVAPLLTPMPTGRRTKAK